MKLVQARVQLFRNILDSSAVEIDPNVTCLVGKNESGKTAFLQALYRLNPARQNAPFVIHEQYPAWLEKRDRQQGKDLDKVQPISVVFKLEEDDKAAVEEKFGPKVFKSDQLAITKSYDGKWTWTPPLEEREAVAHVVANINSKVVAKDAKAVGSFEALKALASTLKGKGAENAENVQAGTELEAAVQQALGGKVFNDVVWTCLHARMPMFFYFADFAKLPYSVKIRELLQTDESKLTDEQATARALLRLGGADKDYLLNPDYERRKRELENVSNALTDDVLKYWTQNTKLRVLPDITQRTEGLQNGQQTVVDELKVRVWDERHGLSLPFDQHSTGFRWFFSFLAAFSEFENRDPPVVILLDEPALGLHAKAQADFLRFIDERLASRSQVIYTTHSPFMIQPAKLERVRMVEDKGRSKGTQVSRDIFTTDPDTLFPLQGALGYDLVQHLFISPNNLVVEGTSDFTYLSLMSDFLRDQGKGFLDPKWSIVPVGGADLVPTFVALLGHHLNVTVLIDARKEGNQRLSSLAAKGYLAKQRIVTVGDVTGTATADIEDLFAIDDYLMLYNAAFNGSVKQSDLTGQDSIVNRIARHLNVARFEHGKPADVLLARRDHFLPKLSAQTLQNFESLFVRLNASLPK